MSFVPSWHSRVWSEKWRASEQLDRDLRRNLSFIQEQSAACSKLGSTPHLRKPHV